MALRSELRWRWVHFRAWLAAGPWLTPAPYWDRCVMGYPLGDDVVCRRRAVDGELWCPKHHPAASDSPKDGKR